MSIKIKNITFIAYIKSLNPKCSICNIGCDQPIENISNNTFGQDDYVNANCGHSFHKNCIEQNKNICNIDNCLIKINKIVSVTN